ncbi:probable polygalacturonase [Nymphaea colorata]|nr:probable polygalacturonase [Nymphaea colorata]
MGGASSGSNFPGGFVDAHEGDIPFPTWESGGLPDGGRERTCAGFFDRSWGEGRQGRRIEVVSVSDFGGVGDGKTSNTEAFRKAIEYLRPFGEKGGSQLNVPRGRWLTGSFNLTSNFTLFLEEGATILGSQEVGEWPIVKPLPSYGRGRERLGGRHISLIHGASLINVVITGENGTIDGQGLMWWDLWYNRTLEHTRGHLIEFINSHNILISNITLLNSPFWTVHPVYCSNVVVKGVTILAPLHSPNTDGIDPDSSTHVCIEDCYIESGDDLVAVKSGWDQYGMAMARPSTDIVVRRVSGTTPTCSGVGIGSEMSGGISQVQVEDMHVWNSAAGIRLKTDKGRGGYIANVTFTNITMENVKVPIRFSSGSNDHPDEGWDPKALPTVRGIVIKNVKGSGVGRAPLLEGLEGAIFEDICIANVSLQGMAPGKMSWQCDFVTGWSSDVLPAPCPKLQSNSSLPWCTRIVQGATDLWDT